MAKSYASNEQPVAHLPVHDLKPTPFADATICAAIDISTSTRGLILSHEALAISTISHQLSKDAKHRGRVLPWSNVAHPVIRLTDSSRLKPSYGTDPSVLCSNYAFSKALQECSLWFLLTDGQILDEDIERFAQGVAENGLHGTACVVILFGRLPRRPVDLDTSVGVSVFAVAPNCLFLFHDVTDGQVYVLQCKGCFTSMLLESWENPSLDSATNWRDLSKINYEDLAHLRVPKPIKLDKDDVALAGGEIINMRDLYQDRLDQRSISEIFNNDDNMRTVLLTAATRGHTTEVEAWLAKQTSPSRDHFNIPRLDIGGQALFYTRKLLDLMKTEHPETTKVSLQARLREAHARNWKAFRVSVDEYNQDSAQHNIIVGDSLDRLTSTRSGSLASPTILSPVSGLVSHSQSQIQRRPVLKTVEPEYLYTTHYRRQPGRRPDRELRRMCALCGAFESPVALLLKKPESGLRTVGLPPPESRAKLAFPLAMGNFPETDIVSSFVCCDPCSYFVTKVGEAPLNEKIVGAIILTNMDGNRHLWKSALGLALEHRFADEDLEMLFLAILYTTLQDVKSGDAKPMAATISSALFWTIDQIQQTALIPTTLSQSLATPNAELTYAQLATVLKGSFLDVSEPNASILKYPVEGFAILVQIIENMLNLKTRDVHNAVFQRFLFHLIEQHHALLLNGESPVSVLEALLATIAAAEASPDGEIPIKASKSSPHSYPSSVPVSSLRGGPLLNEEALSTFQSMGSSFSRIEESGAEEIATFLVQAVQMPHMGEDAVSCFGLLRTSLDLQSMSQRMLQKASQA